jgi:endonuclease/exonuclease/phosphatase family metal-dependent hydrolase
MECAKVIRQWMRRLPADVPVIITGDFNAPAGGEVYKIMSEGLTDAWLAAENKEGPEGTFHGFKGTPGAARIDWILFRGPWKVKRAETVTANRGGRYPSDHFPVIAELVWP